MPPRSSHRNVDASTGSEPQSERALSDLRESIDKRIRPLLGCLPEADLAALIDRMARIQLAYRGGGRRKTSQPNFDADP